MFYNYPTHYLYDMLAIVTLLINARQLFNLNLSKKQATAFVAWMMLFYQINFYITVPYLNREYKYVILYLGLYIGYHFIIKMNVVGSLIVITTTTALNGIFTNINLYFMLKYLFPNYGVALEAQHLQYTCYIISVVILTGLIRVLRVRIFDLQRYI